MPIYPVVRPPGRAVNGCSQHFFVRRRSAVLRPVETATCGTRAITEPSTTVDNPQAGHSPSATDPGPPGLIKYADRSYHACGARACAGGAPRLSGRAGRQHGRHRRRWLRRWPWGSDGSARRRRPALRRVWPTCRGSEEVRSGQSAEGANKRKKHRKGGLGAAAHLFLTLKAPGRQPEGGRRKEPLLEGQRPTRSGRVAAPPAASCTCRGCRRAR